MASFLLSSTCATITLTLTLMFLSIVPTFAGDYVLDIHGQPVGASMDYYIEPQLYGSGGLNVTLHSTTSGGCPQYYIKQLVYAAGSPFSMAPITSWTQYLTTGLPVALYFTHAGYSSCKDVPRWSVGPGQSYVNIDGDQEAASNSTYYFTIELTKESKYGYNIKYCSKQGGQCSALGFVNGVLGINPSDPFPFVFVNANQ